MAKDGLFVEACLDNLDQIVGKENYDTAHLIGTSREVRLMPRVVLPLPTQGSNNGMIA